MAQRRPEVAQEPEQALATHRLWLFGQGEEQEGTAPDGGSARTRFSREAVLAVLAVRGKVSLPESLQLRVRYFAAGALLGTREYVDGMFHALRERWGHRRRDGDRPMQGLAGDLCVLRDLRKQVFR